MLRHSIIAAAVALLGVMRSRDRAPWMGQLRRIQDGDDHRKRGDQARMAKSARPHRRESLRRSPGTSSSRRPSAWNRAASSPR